VAVQLCTLPWLGFVPDDLPSVPAAAVARLSEQLVIPVGELRSYGGPGADPHRPSGPGAPERVASRKLG
jgi:hypothetical protein